MEIFSRTLIDLLPSGAEVFEGDVDGPAGPITVSWVELDGERISGFGTIDNMMSFAEEVW